MAAEAALPAHVVDVDGAKHEGQYISHDESLAYSFGPVSQSGVVRMTVGTSIRPFAVNVDARESAIKPVSREALSQVMGAGVRIEDMQEGVPPRHVSLATAELAPYALLGVIALMLAEILLSAWLGARRQPTRVARVR